MSLLDELSPAEREAWEELRKAEQELERAQLRLMIVTNGSVRRGGHLKLVDEDRPCDARR